MMAGKKRSLSATDSDNRALHKEWDNSLCPVCMEHPHNAVLLLCSSHGKGCRSYICDTSYRHSNCLDRYRKLKIESGDNASPIGWTNANQHSSSSASSNPRPEIISDHPRNETFLSTNVDDIHRADVNISLDRDGYETEIPEPMKFNLKCPLCRGEVRGWEVVKEAREYLNLKTRSCTRESCSFVGNYRELRRHARSIHPSARPAEIDPTRQRAWRRFEHQREYDDVVTAIRSAIPGAVVMGDYVIENGNGDYSTASDWGRGPSELSGPMLTTLFLFQMLGSVDSPGNIRSRPRESWSRNRRYSSSWSRRRNLWGENLLGRHGDNDGCDDEREIDDLSLGNLDDDNDSHVPRRRRRLNRPRSNGDQTP